MKLYLFLIIVLLTTGCRVAVSSVDSSTPTPTPIEEPSPTPVPIPGMGNGVFIQEKISQRIGLIVGTEAYHEEQFNNEYVFTVRFTDGNASRLYGYEMIPCPVQTIKCF